MAIYNTSGTDNWLSNRRKCRNAPFWSKKRDESVLQIHGGVGRGCKKHDSVVFFPWILWWSVFVWKMTKKSENPRCRFLSWRYLGESCFGELISTRWIWFVRFYDSNRSIGEASLFFDFFEDFLVKIWVGQFGGKWRSSIIDRQARNVVWQVAHCVCIPFMGKQSLQSLFRKNVEHTETFA